MTLHNNPQQARQHIRSQIYAAIDRNCVTLTQNLSRHDIVEVLIDIISGQLSVIKDDVRKQRSQSQIQ